jgi:hypothetical protein
MDTPVSAMTSRRLASELLGDGAPDTARTAGHQHNPAFEIERRAHAAAAFCAGGAAL